MNVAFNGLFLSRPYSGTGYYARLLIPALAKKHRLTVYVPEPIKISLPKSVRVKVVPPSRKRLGRGLALDKWETTDLAVAIGKSQADLYHTPYPTPPIKLDIPVVMTVHDMIPWQFPEYRRGARRRIKLGRILTGIRTADHLCTVSQTAAKAIRHQALVSKSAITVTYEALDLAATKPVSVTAVRTFRKAHQLDGPYICYFGGFDGRKNVPALIEAFAKSGLAETHQLVLAGGQKPPKGRLYLSFAELAHLAVASGTNGQIRATDFVSEEDKRALLAGANGFVYPSLAEGFGLPILEALAAGTPVITSDIPSTRELFAGAVTTFDPDNVTGMAKALRQVIARPPKRQISQGKAIAKRFRWSEVATQTSKAYEAARHR